MTEADPQQLQQIAEFIQRGQPLDEETLGRTLFLLVFMAQNAGLDAEAALRKQIKEIILRLDQA